MEFFYNFSSFNFHLMLYTYNTDIDSKDKTYINITPKRREKVKLFSLTNKIKLKNQLIKIIS